MGKNDRIQLSDLPPRTRRALLGLDDVPAAGELRHKYNVGPKESRTCDGILFDSKHEMERYCILKVLEASGQITDLCLQVPQRLHGRNGDYIGDYVADFTYYENRKLVVEDAKGVRTAFYKWKKKMFEAEYGIEIRET